MIIVIRNTKNRGIYKEGDFKNEWRVPGASVRAFDDDKLEEAKKWHNTKIKKKKKKNDSNIKVEKSNPNNTKSNINKGNTTNKKAKEAKNNTNNSKKKSNESFDIEEFLEKYRETKNLDKKVGMVVKLKKEQKKKVLENMTKNELHQYKLNTTALIEKRYACIKRNKACLDALTANIPNIEEIKVKYINKDMSIPVYTIKAIINTFEGRGFSENDYKYSDNEYDYYCDCIEYWERIEERWDTDTGYLSKEEIKARKFSNYHKNANKVKTIIPQLEDFRKEKLEKESRYKKHRKRK